MEPPPDTPIGSPSSRDDFPSLYRAVLEAAAELARRGDRPAAARLRREAIEAYSVWDEQSRRRLLDLLEAARRPSQDAASRASARQR